MKIRNKKEPNHIPLYDADAVHEQIYQHHYQSILQDQNQKQSSNFFLWSNENLQDIDDEEDYWKFYRRKTGKFSLKIIILNICVLLFTMLCISHFNIFGDKGNNQRNALIVWILIWVFITLICLVYFIVYYMIPVYAKKGDKSANNVWDMIASMIIYGKILIIVRTFVSSVMFSDYCYGISGTAESSIVGLYVFLQTLVDLYQALIFSMLPFRWPFIIYFCGIQYIEVILRIVSCQDGFDIPIKHKFVLIFIAKITSYFTNSVIIVSYHTEKSLKNMYTNQQTQQKAAQENIRFVNLLCRDLKLATLKYNHSLTRLIFLLKTRNNRGYETLSESVDGLVGMIDSTNFIIDDVVFIIKVIEKRFKFTLSEDFEVLSAFSQSLNYNSEGDEERMKELHARIDFQISRSLKIKSNKMCFRVLCFYTIHLVLEMLREQEKETKLPLEDKISIKCEIISEGDLNSQSISSADISYLKFNVGWNTGVYFPVTGSKSMIDSACLICDTIANTYGKSYTVSSKGIEFFFPFKNSTLALFNPLLHLEPDHPENLKFKQFMTSEICLLISDNHMESLAKDVIHNLPGGNEIVIIRELQSAAVFAHLIILVQSELIAKQLRENGFSGKIVLLSEKLSYFGELDLKKIDFGIQLPQAKESVSEFVVFLYELYTQSNNLIISHKSGGKPIAISLPPSEFKVRNFRESFYLWKYISHRFFDSPLDLIVLTSSLFYSFLFFLRVLGFVGYVVSICTISFVLFRSTLYWLIQKFRRVSFVSIYKIFIVIAVVGMTENALLDFFQVIKENGGVTVHLVWKNHYDNFEQYLLDKPGITPIGLMTVSYLMGNVDCLRYVGEALPPASSHYLMIVYAIRFFGLVMIYRKFQFISWEIAGSSIIFYCAYGAAFLFCYYEQGGLVKRDFLLLYERLISTDMFERCSFAAKKLLLPRLELFNKAEDQLLNKIAELSQKETIMTELVALSKGEAFEQRSINNRILLLSPEMVQQIQRLQHYRRLALSLRFSLKTVETRFFPTMQRKSAEEKKMELLIDVKAHMMRNVVEEVVQSFIHGGYDTLIRYYVVIHPSVAMIRINKDLFTTTLIDLIQQSLSRLERNFEELPYLQKIDHQMLIWIQPTKVVDRIIPFSEVRELQMTVLDTGMVKMRKGGELFEGFEMKVEKGEEGSSIFFSNLHPTSSSPSRTRHSQNEEENSNPVGKTLFTEYHKLSDQFLEIFGLTHRSEMGMLYHQQYKSFQKVAFPFLPCTISNQIESVLKERQEYSRVMKVDPQNPRVYYRYSVEQMEDILSIIADLSQNGNPRSVTEIVDPNSENQNTNMKLTKDQLSEIKLVEKSYKKFWDQSLSLLSSSLPENTKPKIKTNSSFPVELPPLQKGCVTVYGVEGEETSRRSHWLHHSFQKHRLAFRFGELESYPKRSFQGSDIIILEYSPKFVKHKFNKTEDNSSKKIRSNGRDYYYRLEMPYNVRNVIHYLRAVGFTGMIVLVYQDPKNKMDGKKLDSYVEGNDETDSFYESNLANPNAYSDAAKADLQLTLPWNESLIDSIVNHWKQKRFSDLFFQNFHINQLN